MRIQEFRDMLYRCGVTKAEWREQITQTVALHTGWAQFRSFCYGIIFAAFILWVAQNS